MRLSPPYAGGRARVLVIGATLGVVVAMAGTAAAAPTTSDGTSTHFYEKVDGYLQGYPGDCPPAEAPQDPLVCHEVVLTAFRVGTNETTIAPPKASWVLIVLRHTLSFPGGGGEPTESDVVEGFSEDPVVTFDQQHLSAARVVADDVPMTDGSTLDVDATWTATSDRLHYGNDGPAIAEGGLVHHLKGGCLNSVNQAHQKYRLAHVHAILDGTPSDDLSMFAFIAYNHFTYLEVHPQGCA